MHQITTYLRNYKQYVRVIPAIIMFAGALMLATPAPASAASGYRYSKITNCLLGGGPFAKKISFYVRYFDYGDGTAKLDGYHFEGNYRVYRVRLSQYLSGTLTGQVNTNVPNLTSYTRLDLKNYFNPTSTNGVRHAWIELYTNDSSLSPCKGDVQF